MVTDEIARVARRLLANNLQELVGGSTGRLLDDEAGYETINRADLRQQMERTLTLTLMRLSGMSIPPGLSSAAYETGQLRAYQNLELSSVLHSFRIDLRILWEAIVREGKALELDTSPGFMEGLVEVWEAVEANIADVVEGYRRATDRVSRRTEEMRLAAFERLLLEGERDVSIVTEASKALAFPISTSYLCLVGVLPEPQRDLLNRILARLNQRNIPSQFSWGLGELVGVIAIRNSTNETVQHLEDLQRFTCGIFEVDDLGSVPRGVRMAKAAIRGRSQPGIRHLNQSWTAAFTAIDRELSECLVTAVLEPLASLPTTERDGCFETIAAYAVSDGSIADIAKITYRHRNTIRKRLQHIESVTGLDLSRPADITTLTLAYEAYSRRREEIHRA